MKNIQTNQNIDSFSRASLLKYIPDLWKTPLCQELPRDSDRDIKALMSFVKKERQDYKVFPKVGSVFKALGVYPCDDPHEISVVILGQDPYHTEGQANGLAFSCEDSSKISPSLQNIYEEIFSDIGIYHNWGMHHASQGVLLLNTALTVREGDPFSHAKPWKFLTQALISVLLKSPSFKVFLLWGSKAQVAVEEAKMTMSESLYKNHAFLKTSHPSPFSYHKGFKGCRHFSKTNALLLKHKKPKISW